MQVLKVKYARVTKFKFFRQKSETFFLLTRLIFGYFQGVTCTEGDEGYRCGLCPPGFTGNGQNCYRMCTPNSCAPGRFTFAKIALILDTGYYTNSKKL